MTQNYYEQDPIKDVEKIKSGLCAFVRQAKADNGLTYADIEQLGIGRTSLNCILNKDGYQVSLESIIALIIKMGYEVDWVVCLGSAEGE